MVPLSSSHTQKVVHHLAQQGIEMTPEEVVEERKKAYETIRRELRALGYEVPDDDVSLYTLMRETLNQE